MAILSLYYYFLSAKIPKQILSKLLPPFCPLFHSIVKLVSKNRLTVKKFQAFDKWRSITRLNFPLFPRKRRYKLTIPNIIQKLNERLVRDLKSSHAIKLPQECMKYITAVGLYRRLKRLSLQDRKIDPAIQRKIRSHSTKNLLIKAVPSHFKRLNKSQSLLKIRPKARVSFKTPMKRRPKEQENGEDDDSKEKGKLEKQKKPPIPRHMQNQHVKAHLNCLLGNQRSTPSGVCVGPGAQDGRISVRLRPYDQFEFFRKFLHFFEVVRLKVNQNYRTFFFQMAFLKFVHTKNNFNSKSSTSNITK